MDENQKLKLMTILLKTSNSVQHIAKEQIKSYTCNMTEFGVLEALHQKGRMTIKELRERVLIPSSSMTYVLDQLCQKKLIERVKNEEDKRNFLIRLTNEGFKYTFKIIPEHYEQMEKVFDVLSDDEIENLQVLLKKLGYYAKELEGAV